MKYSAEFCNREYDARSAIPDRDEIFARWRKAGASARAALGGSCDIAYGGSPLQTLDLFPAGRADAPLLVFIHGGWWRSLDKSDFSWIAPPFVERGVAVALVNYDLAPAVTIDAIVLQVLRALEWLWRAGPRRGFDASRMIIAGHSAGAHLATMAACALWPQWDPDLPADIVKACVAVSGVYDLEPLRHATFLNGDLRLTEHSAARLSPAWMPPATTAPVVTAVGELESASFHDQAALLASRWKTNLHAEVPMPGRNHLTVVDGLAEPQSPLFGAALALCQ